MTCDTLVVAAGLILPFRLLTSHSVVSSSNWLHGFNIAIRQRSLYSPFTTKSLDGSSHDIELELVNPKPRLLFFFFNEIRHRQDASDWKLYQIAHGYVWSSFIVSRL
jgi:hypothetical protein